MTGGEGDRDQEGDREQETRRAEPMSSPSPGPGAGDRRSVLLARPSLGSRSSTSIPSDYHPLSPASGTPRHHLTRRVSSVADAQQGPTTGHFDVQTRRHAASVSTPGASRTASGTGTGVVGSPMSASTANASPSSTSSPAVAALQAVAATHVSGVMLTPRRADSDLLGLGVGPSRRSRRASADPVETARTTASLFGDDDEATPRRPPLRPARMAGGTPLAGGWSGYLDSLSRDEIEVLDTPFDVMSDTELGKVLQPYVAETKSSIKDKSKRASANGSSGSDIPKSGGLDSPKKSAQTSSPGTPGTPQTVATPLFPPSPPGTVATRAEHPLRVLSRAVRELREVISRLEEDNARLRLRETSSTSTATLAMSAPPQRPSFASSGSGLNIHLPHAAPTSAETSPRPLPLPSVAERPRDQLHDSLADALSTSLTSPTHSHLSLMEPRLDMYHHHDDDNQSPTPSTLSFARPKSPAMSTRSVVSVSDRERARAHSGASSTTNLLDQKDGNKKGWGIFGWAKKPHRKGSVSSLTPSMSGLVPSLEPVEDDEWRRGDGGSAPSFRAIFLATRILTPDAASILIEPARANATLAGLAHALVSTARDDDIAVREPPGRARARSRAASISSARHIIQPSIDVTSNDLASPSPGYGDTALAATVGFGRSILSLSRGKGNDEYRKSRPSLPPVRMPRSGYPHSQSSPHTPVTPNPSAIDTPPPSVELGTIVPDESRPPTVLLSRQNLGSFFQSSRSKLATATRFESDDPPLTDRYGFIYDIQHANMLKDASRAGTPAPISLTGHIPEMRHSDTLEVPSTSRPASTHSTEERNDTLRERSPTATGTNNSSPASTPSVSQPSSSTPEPSSPPNANTQRPRRPTALAPTPAKPIAAKDQLTVSVRGSSSLGSTASTVPAPSGTAAKASASRLTVSSLLAQLTDIHDKQQKARTAEWDTFLRRRTRRKGSSERRGAVQDVGVSGAIAAVVSLAGTQSKSGQEEYRLFQRLVRRGIPIPYRADVWAECSGARDLLVPGEYAEILAVHRDDYSPVMAEIEKDVGRTFPGNVFFGGDGPGVAKLRRLLVAYSWHNPAVGYCQGMNMLAATLLLTHTDEEQAFWVLHCMIERLLPADYYSPSLEGSRADQLALADLVTQHVPRVAFHLNALGVDLTSVTFGWFLSLFTDCLPVETLFRVWDVFFVEGHAVLFRVAIAILKLNEAELCATESVTDLFSFISGMTSRLWGADKLIALQHSYKSAMRDPAIQALVERYAGELQRDSEGESE